MGSMSIPDVSVIVCLSALFVSGFHHKLGRQNRFIVGAGLVPNTLQRQRTGDHKGPPPRILTPLAPTIRRIGPPRPCIVGAGEDVDGGMGPLWLPVRTHFSNQTITGALATGD